MELAGSDDGKRAARFEIRKDWAERAEIWLTTTTLDYFTSGVNPRGGTI